MNKVCFPWSWLLRIQDHRLKYFKRKFQACREIVKQIVIFIQTKQNLKWKILIQF